jgi:hypothetical protein
MLKRIRSNIRTACVSTTRPFCISERLSAVHRVAQRGYLFIKLT